MRCEGAKGPNHHGCSSELDEDGCIAAKVRAIKRSAREMLSRRAYLNIFNIALQLGGSVILLNYSFCS
jgi:hypothetical protein